MVNLSATMERVLEERSRELILPLVEQPATESKPAVVSDVSAEIPAALPRPMRVATAAPMTPGALRTSDGIIQIGPFTGGDHHRPDWNGRPFVAGSAVDNFQNENDRIRRHRK